MATAGSCCRIAVIVERVDGRTWCHDGSAVQLSVTAALAKRCDLQRLMQLLWLYLPTDAVLALCQRRHSGTLVCTASASAPATCARGSDS